MKETEHHIKMALVWGAVIILVFVLFGFLGRIERQGKQGDLWLVEAQVVKKSTTMRENGENGSEKVYLIEVYPLNKEEGLSAQTFEVTDTSLDGRFTGEQVFHQIRTGKAYRFKVGWRNREIIDKDGYYPSIYGAATLLDVPLMEIEEKESQTTKESEEEMDPSAARGTVEPLTAKSAEEESTDETQKETASESTTDSTVNEEESTEIKKGGIKIEIVEETVKEESSEE